MFRACFVGFLLLTSSGALAAAEGLPCTPEPTSMTITYGDLVLCAIDIVGDTDVFRFAGSAGEVVSINVARQSGGNPCIELFDLDGTRVGGRSSCDSRIDVALPKTGTYTIRVNEFVNDQTVPYALSLERTAPPSPSARPIGFGQNIQDEINPVGDVDLFSFQGMQEDAVTVQVSRRNGGNPCVEVFDPDGKRVGAQSSCDSRVDVRLPRTGTYAVRVNEFIDDSTVAYTIDLQCIGACPAGPPPPPGNCTYFLAPTSQVVPSTASTGSIGVLTASGCPWTASSSAGHITVTSGASGNGPGTVQYSVAANTAAASRTGTLAIAGQTATITQSGTAPLLLVSPSPLAFGFREGGAAPADQVLSVFTNTATLNFTAAATGGNWLAVSPRSGAAPASLVVSAYPAGLAPGSYQGTVTVTAPTANPTTSTVTVSLTVEAAGQPKLALESEALTFAFAEGAPPRVVRRGVSNRGGGTLVFRATTVGAPWLRVSPESGEATLAQTASLLITADPSRLRPGTYTGRIAVTAGNERSEVPVTLTVSSVRQTMLLSQTGLTFTAVASGGAVPPQSVGVLNLGQGVMDWQVSAATASGGNWLAVSPARGTTDASSLSVPLVEIGINAAGLAPGEYHGQVRVEAPAADNTPQFVGVVLSVLPAGSDPGPVVRPTGLIFTGAQPAAQPVRISNLTGSAKTFTSGRLTIDGANWFTVQPTSGTVTPSQPATVQVTASSAGLTPGIRRGVLTLLFADGAARTVNLLFVLPAGSAGAQKRAADGCAPAKLLPLITSLGSEFTVPAGWPVPVEVRVVDDCGNPMVEGSVVASFSNGDEPVPLVPLKDGRWVKDWTAKRADVSQVTVTVTAEAPELKIQGHAQVTGGLRGSPDRPLVASGGVLNAASYAVGAPLAPGSMVSIFGSKLARGEGRSPRLPLETQLAGVLVTLGGKPVPLIVATEGQINAVVPYGLAVNAQHQLIVRKADSYTMPEPVTVAGAQPAIFTKDASGRGQGIIVTAEGGLAEPGNAAVAGSPIVLFATGLGEVTPSVEAGAAAPTVPLAAAAQPAGLKIGGVEATVAFAGLVPGFTGLYQVNAVVPEGVEPGDAVEVVLTVAGLSSPPVTMAVR